MTDDVANEGAAVSDGPDGLPGEIARLHGEIEDLRSSRRRLVSAADADRRAFEAELHGGVQQYLVAFTVDLRRLAGLIDDDPTAARVLADEMTASVRAAMAETAALAERIYPPLLASRGLAGTIRSAAQYLGVAVQVNAPAGIGYPSEVTTAIYWSCIEVLTFASRESEATVDVVDRDGVLTFDVGIDRERAEVRVAGMRDRVEALGGHVVVDERTGGGTRVHGWIPGSR